MEMREWVIRILSADTLQEKLFSPPTLTDHTPGPQMLWNKPVRPAGMGFKKRAQNEKLPHFQNHNLPDNRAICLHRFAGHELLAVEIMAYALLKFPDAPKHFRRGLANTLKEEQGHVQLYIDRMKRFNLEFGDLDLYSHFWNHTPFLHTPTHYVSVMSLTLEMANLDFAPIYGKSFRHHGDHESAALMDQILEDEIAHVSFGMNWLRKFKKPDEDEYELWANSLTPLLTPKRAKGFVLNEKPRLQAGVTQSWIDNLKKH